MIDTALENYYYGHQIKRYIISFMAIFAGLKVAIGKNDLNSASNLISVPIAYGSRDRVVAAIQASNTQNKPIRVPCSSAYKNAFEKDETLYKGVGTTKTDVHLPLGATLPDGLVTVKKYMPIPYRLGMELSIYASNTDQELQMLEQISMLFSPTLQIQTSDAVMDWTKLTTVTLESVISDETYPAATTRRILTTTFNFSMPIYLSPPYNLRQDYIEQIRTRINAVDPSQSLYDYFHDADATDYDVTVDPTELGIPSQ